MRAWFWCLCIVMLEGVGHAYAQSAEPGDSDPIAAKLLVAQAEFERSLDSATKDVLARLDELIEKATRMGEFEQLRDLRTQRSRFEETGALPTDPGVARTVSAFVRARDRAHSRLFKAYDLAIAEYTRERALGQAEAAQAERDRRAKAFTKEASSALGSAAAAGPLDPRGEPIEFLAGRSRALAAVWIDDLGIYHVRFAPGATGKRFEGTIRVRGGAWAGPVVPVLTGQSRKPDRGVFLNESTFEYEIHTPRNRLDGLDLQVAGAGAELIFEMKANGALLPADSIVIGKDGIHPPGGQFVLKNIAARPGRRSGRAR
jgi:hypothetical protein